MPVDRTTGTKYQRYETKSFSEQEKKKLAEEYAQVRKACEQGEIG